MSRFRADTSHVAAARRGQIIQRVLVDGWSAAQAAAACDVKEREVVRWVAAYRRHGMASLRGEVARVPAPRRWASRVRAVSAWIATRLRLGCGPVEPARRAELRRRDDIGRRR